MPADLREHARVMRMVADDCEVDAMKVDRTPFTPKGVGETFGSMLAQIAACARSVAVIADMLAEREEQTVG